MCNPVAVVAAQAIAGVAQAGAAGSAAKKGAAAQASHNHALAIHRNEQFTKAVEYQQKVAEWQDDNYFQTYIAAQENATSQYAAILGRVDQMRDEAIDRIQQYSRSARQGKAVAALSAAESETTGQSVALAQQQYEQAEARATHLSYKNLSAKIRQSEAQMLQIQANAQGQVNRAMRGPMKPIDPWAPVAQVESPSMFPYVLQGVSSVIGAAATYQRTMAIQASAPIGG